MPAWEEGFASGGGWRRMTGILCVAQASKERPGGPSQTDARQSRPIAEGFAPPENSPMNPLRTLFRRHLSWRPAYYRRLWQARRYLKNYREIVRASPRRYPEAFHFRAGHSWRISDAVTELQVFEEVFGQEHYRLSPTGATATVIDIGANNGLFSLYAHLKLPAARIYAIEANPLTYQSLVGNIGANALQETVRPVNRAISATNGTVTFYCSSTSGWSSLFPTRGAEGGQAVSVQSMSLSSFCAAQGIGEVDVLKIDVEGAEYDIILGDPQFFSVPVRELYLEVDQHPRDTKYEFKALLDLLRRHYRSVTLRCPGFGDYPLIHCSERVG
jgi:FkbM family methyltransferase